MPSIFDVSVPKINRQSFLENLSRNWDSYDKKLIYFLDLQRTLLANYFPNYKDVLNRVETKFIQTPSLIWALSQLQKDHISGVIYARFIEQINKTQKNNELLYLGLQPLKYLLFLTFYTGCLGLNLLSWLTFNIFKPKIERKLELEKVSSADLIWDILQFAHKKSLKLAIVGGSSEAESLTSEIVQTIFPNINLKYWSKPRLSNLITDIPHQDGSIIEPNAVLSNFYSGTNQTLLQKILILGFRIMRLCLPKYGKYLNPDNVSVYYPDLYEAEDFVIQEQPDIVLLCLGGESGKQEYFADRLKSNQDAKFKLLVATGGELELDQIAPAQSGFKGKITKFNFSAPEIFKRIRQNFTLLWWTTLQQFTDYLDFRPTSVCNLINKTGDYLLVKRTETLPGDFGWTFVQGGIDPGESVSQAAIREINEEVGFSADQIEIQESDTDFSEEIYPVSLVRFLALGAMYQGAQAYVVKLTTQTTELPQTNFENLAGGWFNKWETFSYLSPEKRIYYRKLD
ncbi:MAG: hypothetical protein OHK0017_04230 [Patescibacteria group bacterium]